MVNGFFKAPHIHITRIIPAGQKQHRQFPVCAMPSMESIRLLQQIIQRKESIIRKRKATEWVFFILPHHLRGRTAEGLKTGLAKLKDIRKEFETELFIPGSKEGLNVELDKAFRLNDFITMGELIAYDALNRNESCGGHFREEYQTEEGEAKRDDENFFYVACWEYQGSDDKAPVLYKEPLVYEAIKVQTRNYKS